MPRRSSHISRELKENLGLVLNVLSFLGLTVISIFAGIYQFLGRQWIWAIYALTLILLISLLVDYARIKRRMRRLARSGVIDYYSEYRSTFSQGFWKQTNHAYRYLGITGSSFSIELKHWMNTEGKALRYEFLLLDPHSPFLHQVEGERLGLAADDRSQTTKEAIQNQVRAKQSQFQSTVQTLRSTIPAQNHHVRIKVYDAYPAYWMEVLDDQKILMGILSPLRPGPQSPLLVLEPRGDYSFYHSMWDQWQRLWQKSTDYP